ncbi:hypothetical protein RMCBS344292_15095 [Rhizopus microsporus]|nr:hypothetical protein RMCBS344292_15095 [Rhizopus microsporus]
MADIPNVTPEQEEAKLYTQKCSLNSSNDGRMSLKTNNNDLMRRPTYVTISEKFWRYHHPNDLRKVSRDIKNMSINTIMKNGQQEKASTNHLSKSSNDITWIRTKFSTLSIGLPITQESQQER